MTDPLKHVDAIAELANEHGFTVGAAESLTGGAVSSALARGTQAAMWFHGGVVSYSRLVKYGLLGDALPAGLRAVRAGDGRGCRSRADGRRRGVHDRSRWPGPGQEGHAPGTLYVGVLVRGELACHRLEIDGDPGEVVELTLKQAS